MKSSNTAYKRARPAFGTFLSVNLNSDANSVRVESVLHRTFSLAESLEKVFSKFRSDSDVSRVNEARDEIAVSEDFVQLFSEALKIYEESGGGFTPFMGGEEALTLFARDGQWFARRHGGCRVDLSGIAKGYCVDRLGEFLHAELPEASGVVNAGGDLRFFNSPERRTAVRSARDPSRLRLLRVEKNGVATSSFSESRDNPFSTTVYPRAPRAGLDDSFSVTAIAGHCAVADALTKVGWFADEEKLAHCAHLFQAQVLIFDGEGEEVARYQ